MTEVDEHADAHHLCEEEGDAEAPAVEGHCYMTDTKFQTPEGRLVAAADLSIGDNVLDHQGIVRAVSWCRKLPKKKRLLVDLHTKPLTVTGSHRIIVPDGEVEAKELSKNSIVVMGCNFQQILLKITKRYHCSEVMELEFEGDAIVEVHSPSILTKGSNPSLPIDQDGAFKCKEEQQDERSMSVNTMETGVGSTSTGNHTEDADQAMIWPDTEDDLR